MGGMGRMHVSVGAMSCSRRLRLAERLPANGVEKRLNKALDNESEVGRILHH